MKKQTVCKICGKPKLHGALCREHYNEYMRKKHAEYRKDPDRHETSEGWDEYATEWFKDMKEATKRRIQKEVEILTFGCWRRYRNKPEIYKCSKGG